MAGDEISLFPDLPTLIFSLMNFAILLTLVGAIGFGIVWMVRLGRRVERIEQHLNQRKE